MKKTTLFIGAAAIALCMCGCSQSGTVASETVETEKTCAPAGSIVYFNLDKVLEEYNLSKDLRAEVEKKMNGIQQELSRRQKNLEKDINDFQNKINKGLLTQAMAEEKGAKLEQQRNQFLQYSEEKNREMAEEQSVMMNRIADAIKTYVDEYNAEKGYAMILSTQGPILPAPVVCADPLLDVSDELIAGLNAAYEKQKSE